MSDGGVSAGEVGGMFAGGMALLATIGAGLKWFLGWAANRAESRAAKLQAWHEELDRREGALDAKIEGRLAAVEAKNAQIEREHTALRLAFEIVAGELRAKDPANSALKRAEQILSAVFPLDPMIPGAMAASLAQLGDVAGTDAHS